MPSLEEQHDLYIERLRERRALFVRSMIQMAITLLVALSVMTIVTIVPSVKQMIDAKNRILDLQARGYEIIPDLESRVAELDKRLQTLTSSELSERLSKIEKAIAVGDVKPEDLTALQQIREQVAELRSYMSSQPEKIVEFRTVRKDYSDLKRAVEATMTKDDIMREVRYLHNLYYATLTLVGILVSLLAGAWFLALRRQMGFGRAASKNGEATKGQ